jgi:hypothetical protein
VGRATAGLILALLAGSAAAGEGVPHERVLLRGDVPLRIAADSSPVCAFEVRVDAPHPEVLAAWQGEIEGRFGDSGLTAGTAAAETSAFRLAAPAAELPALIDAVGSLIAQSRLAGAWRAVSFVCAGPRDPWVARLDAAFGRDRRAVRAAVVPAAPPEAGISVRTGPPSIEFSWSAGELGELEARVALELRRDAVVRALEGEEIDASVAIETAFGRSDHAALLRIDPPAAQPMPALLDLVRAALAELDEAPLDPAVLDARWAAEEVALLRAVDSPLRRVRMLGEAEDRGSDPWKELAASRRSSSRAFHLRCASLSVDRAAVVVSHPRPPTHGDLVDEPPPPRNPHLDPSFEEEEG